MGVVSDTGIWVTLERAEVTQAAIIGVDRFMESRAKGRQHNLPVKPGDDLLSLDIKGAMGEMAYAKARGLYYEPRVNTFKEADFGSNVQIRTGAEEGHSLIIRKTDNPEHFYVLVIGSAPTFRVVGWIKGADAMAQAAWLKDWAGRSEAWFVPQSALTPFKAKEQAA